jgi:hypothetical protein
MHPYRPSALCEQFVHLDEVSGNLYVSDASPLLFLGPRFALNGQFIWISLSKILIAVLYVACDPRYAWYMDNSSCLQNVCRLRFEK